MILLLLLIFVTVIIVAILSSQKSLKTQVIEAQINSSMAAEKAQWLLHKYNLSKK